MCIKCDSYLGLFDGIHQCGIFRDQCMRIRSFLGSDYRDCHVNLPHIIRRTCPRLRSSCGCHLFLYEDGNKTRKNAENIRVSKTTKNIFILLYFHNFSMIYRQIGPAVFNGGFSTFLAFILLAFSDSYVFLTFVKMFGMVVVFGLFHGLIFLPVLLSLIGPAGSPDEDCESSIESPVVVSKDENGSNNRCNSPINSLSLPDVEKR